MDGLALRGPAGELGRVDRGDPAGEDGPVRADELHAVARPEVALPAADADREQARATLDDRLAGAGVDRDLPGDPLPVAQPELERGSALGGREARARRAAGERGREHVLARSVGDHRCDARARRELCGGDLALHAAAPERAAGPEHRRARRGSVLDQHALAQHAGHRRQQNEQPRAHEHGDLRRERVVVAEADLVGRRRVVLVHDRHRTEREQGAESAAHVHVRAALADLGAREQNLRDLDAVRLEHVLPRALQRGLTERRRGLQPRQARRTLREPEPPQPERDRTRRHDADRRAALDDLGDLRRAMPQQRAPRTALLVDDEARAELDDERALHRCCVPSPTTRYCRR